MTDINLSKEEIQKLKREKESVVLKKLQDIVNDVLTNKKPKS